MNADSHEAAWQAWSIAERGRLLALPRGELLLAVQTGALENLRPEDAQAVLSSLAGFKSGLPAVLDGNRKIRTIHATGRRPDPFSCRGLPIGPKITILMRLKQHIGLVTIAIALLLWVLIFSLGNHWLVLHSAIG